MDWVTATASNQRTKRFPVGVLLGDVAFVMERAHSVWHGHFCPLAESANLDLQPIPQLSDARCIAILIKKGLASSIAEDTDSGPTACGTGGEAVHRGTQRRQRSCRVRKVVHQRARHCREENEHWTGR